LNFEAKLVLQIFTSSKNFKIWAETLSIRTSLKNNKVFKFTFLEYIFFLLKMIFFILSRTDTLCTDNNVSFCLFFLFNSYTHSHTYTHTHTRTHNPHTYYLQHLLRAKTHSHSSATPSRSVTILSPPLSLSRAQMHTYSQTHSQTQTHTHSLTHTHAFTHTQTHISTHQYTHNMIPFEARL